MSNASTDEDQTSGPENPRAAGGPDAPAPPGGPQRTDAAEGTTTPGGPSQPQTAPEPEVHPSSPPDGPATVPSPESPEAPGPPTAEPSSQGEVHAQTQTDQVNEELQEENAETALDQPSDGSGGE